MLRRKLIKYEIVLGLIFYLNFRTLQPRSNPAYVVWYILRRWAITIVVTWFIHILYLAQFRADSLEAWTRDQGNAGKKTLLGLTTLTLIEPASTYGHQSRDNRMYLRMRTIFLSKDTFKRSSGHICTEISELLTFESTTQKGNVLTQHVTRRETLSFNGFSNVSRVETLPLIRAGRGACQIICLTCHDGRTEAAYSFVLKKK